MTTLSQLNDAVEVALAGEISEVKVYSPNRVRDIPEPTGDPDNPTTFIAWSVGDDSWSQEDSGFGYRFYRGTLLFALTTEWGGGELDISAFAAEIESLLLAASTSGLHFYEARIGDSFGAEDEAWMGRILEIPYSREEAKAA